MTRATNSLIARKWFRRFFPRRRDPLLDADVPPSARDTQLSAIYDDLTRSEPEDTFVRARYFEGRRWRHVISQTSGVSGRTLDVGGGNGAIELAFAAGGSWIASVELSWNETARRLHRSAGTPLRRVVASADALPFRDDVFAHVLCLETLEHFSDARGAAQEIVRVLSGDGAVLLTTPPRARFLFRADPHFGIPGLLLLPAALQRRIAAARGFNRPDHFVDRIYWTVGQVRKVFPRCSVRVVLSRSRGPRFLLWDAVLLRKDRP